MTAKMNVPPRSKMPAREPGMNMINKMPIKQAMAMDKALDKRLGARDKK